jgi:hypothetical protein
MKILQILNTTGDIKSGAYVAGVCKDLLADLRQHAPDTMVSGFVMDSASANRSAMQLLDEDDDVHPLVNLQCAAHTLSLLMKDHYKHFEWVRNVYNTASFISTTVMGVESYGTIFQQQVMLDQGRTGAVSSHSETRLGSHFLALKSVLRYIDSLVSMVGSQPFLQFRFHFRARKLLALFRETGQGVRWEDASCVVGSV